MPIYKITPSEIEECRISNLPTRPSFPSLYAGKLLSASELRAAFDALPLLVADAINDFVDALGLFEEKGATASLAELIATGLFQGHSLSDLFADIKNGSLATYLSADGTRALSEVLEKLENKLDALQILTVETVGEGDSVCDVALEGSRLLLYKRNVKEEVTEELHRAFDPPISSLTKRMDTLEHYAEDTLYTYVSYMHHSNGFLVSQNVCSNAMITLLGGHSELPIVQNLLPERAFPFLFPPHDTLSMTWDDSESALRLDGTLLAGESIELPFFTPINQFAYSSKLFYVGGEVSATELPTFAVRVANGETICAVSLKNETTKGKLSFTSALINYSTDALVLTATADTVFSDYRFQLAFCVGDAPDTHENPIFLRNEHNPPFAFHIRGKNLWSGNSEVSGTECVEFTTEQPIPAGTYTLSFDQLSEGVYGHSFLTVLSFSDGSTVQKSIKPFAGVRAAYSVTTTAPLCGFTVYATSSKKGSTDVPLTVTNVMLEQGDRETPAFFPYHEDKTVEIPSYLRSLPGFAVTVNESNFNEIDLETMCYTKNCTPLTLNGEELWEDTEDENVFALAIDTNQPTNIFTTGLFAPLGEYMPNSIWYSDYYEKIVVMCPGITSAEELRELIRVYPFHLGLVFTKTKYAFSPEQITAGNCEILLPVAEGDTVTAIDENGAPTRNYTAHVLYQIKVT